MFCPPCRLATTTSTCPILGPTRGLWTVQPRHLSPPPPPRWWIWTLQKSTLRAPSTPSWPAAPAPTTLTRSSVTTIKRLLVHRYEETTQYSVEDYNSVAMDLIHRYLSSLLEKYLCFYNTLHQAFFWTLPLRLEVTKPWVFPDLFHDEFIL